MMTLSQLRTFQVVARLNSFSRAAEELHLTQPAISSQIVALENSLKIKLFDRMGKKIALTEQGCVVLSCAEDIDFRLSQMKRELADLGELSAGTLHIGASLLVGVYLMPEILARFKEKYPQVKLVVSVESARQIIDMTLRNDLDIAVIGEGSPLTDERIAVKPILNDELVLIVPPGHPLAGAVNITPAEVEREAFLLPARDSACSESILEQLSAAGISLHSALEFGNTGAVKRAVEAGLGVSIVSRYAVIRELEDGRLKCLRISGMTLDRQLLLCWHHGKRFSNLTTAFVQFVQKYMNTLR